MKREGIKKACIFLFKLSTTHDNSILWTREAFCREKTNEFCKGRWLTGLLCCLVLSVAFWNLSPDESSHTLFGSCQKSLKILLPTKKCTNFLTWQQSNFPTLFSTPTPIKTSWSVFSSPQCLSLCFYSYFILCHFLTLTLSHLTKPYPSLKLNSSLISFWKEAIEITSSSEFH